MSLKMHLHCFNFSGQNSGILINPTLDVLKYYKSAEMTNE